MNSGREEILVTESLIPIMIIDDKSRYSTHENNRADQIVAANEMGECLKNAMTDCYLNNMVTKEAYISNIQKYFSRASHKLTFEPNMEVTLVDQYGRPWNEQSSVSLTSKAVVPKSTSEKQIATPSGFVASINDFGQGKVVYIVFQEVEEALGYRLYVDGTYKRDIINGIKIPIVEFASGTHTFAMTAFNSTNESDKTASTILSIEPIVEPTAPEPTTSAPSTTPNLATKLTMEETAPDPTTSNPTTPSPTTKSTVEETLPAPEKYSSNGPGTVDALTLGANFYLGMWDGLENIGEGINNIVHNPINTLIGIGSILIDPKEAAVDVGTAMYKSFDQNVLHGDANSRSRFSGRTAFEIGLLYAGSELKKLTVSKELDVVKGAKKFNGFDANISRGKQGKHISGHNNYIKGKSSFTGTMDDAQRLINKYTGKGQALGINRERVDFGEIIGKYVNPKTGEAMDTTVGIIHYSKTGAHIVPARPIK